jgi:hypothetical protein
MGNFATTAAVVPAFLDRAEHPEKTTAGVLDRTSSATGGSF